MNQPPQAGPRAAAASANSSLPTLDDWGPAVSGGVDLPSACRQILERLLPALGASRGSLMVVNPLTGRLAIRAAVGLPAEFVGVDVHPRPGSIAEWVFRHKRGLVLNGEVSDQRFEGSAEGSVESALCVPLVGSSGSLGILNLSREAAPLFGEGEMRAAQDLAPVVAAALERLQEAQLAERAWTRMRALRGRGLRSQVPVGRSEVRGYQFGYARRPSLQMAADLCERVSHSNGEHALLMTDLANDGPEALVTASLVQGLFLGLAVADRPPVALVARLNAELCARLTSGSTVNLWTASLTATGQLSYCNAGFPPALWIAAESGQIHPLQTLGLAVGTSLHARYDEETLRLLPGDTIVVTSEALLQVHDAAERSFGIERLGEIVAENRRQPLDRLVEAVMEAVLEHGGRPNPSDDLSLLILRFTRGE